MILSQEELQAIKAGSLTIDCTSMKLVPVLEGNREKYIGSGLITLNERGLSFKLLSSQDYSFRDIVLESSSKSGQLFEDLDYFWLYALDVQGRSWRSARTLPKFTLSSNGLVAIGNLEEIQASEDFELPIEKAMLRLWFSGDLQFPFDRAAKWYKSIEDIVVSESWSVSCSSFKSGRYDFSAMFEDGWSKLDVEGDSISDYLSSRVEESLEFMLARPVRASVVGILEKKQVSVFVRSVEPELDVKSFKSPLVPSSSDYRKMGWGLFDSFFRYAVDYEERARPPLSRILQYVVQMASSPIDAQALALGVAVEGLLDERYSSLGEPSAELLKEIDEAMALVRESGLSEKMKARILGSISVMKRSRAKDCLLSLKDANVITKEQCDAWGSLRNSTAHAVVHGLDNEFLSLCNRVLVLFYCLLFRAIGYRGPFTDYGIPGWPQKTYPLNSVIEEGAESPLSVQVNA